MSGCFLIGTISILFLGGVAILIWGLQLLLVRLVALRRLQYITGTVTHVERSTVALYGATVRGTRPKAVYRPTISYVSAGGETATFTSESADSTGYAVGQRVEIVIDPAGCLQPMVRKDLWFLPTILTLAGLVLTIGAGGFAWLMYFQRSSSE